MEDRVLGGWSAKLKLSLADDFRMVRLFRVQVPEYACGNCIGCFTMREVADAFQKHALEKRDHPLPSHLTATKLPG
jgi:hypothetical protein